MSTRLVYSWGKESDNASVPAAQPSHRLNFGQRGFPIRPSALLTSIIFPSTSFGPPTPFTVLLLPSPSSYFLRRPSTSFTVLLLPSLYFYFLQCTSTFFTLRQHKYAIHITLNLTRTQPTFQTSRCYTSPTSAHHESCPCHHDFHFSLR